MQEERRGESYLSYDWRIFFLSYRTWRSLCRALYLSIGICFYLCPYVNVSLHLSNHSPRVWQTASSSTSFCLWPSSPSSFAVFLCLPSSLALHLSLIMLKEYTHPFVQDFYLSSSPPCFSRIEEKKEEQVSARERSFLSVEEEKEGRMSPAYNQGFIEGNEILL